MQLAAFPSEAQTYLMRRFRHCRKGREPDVSCWALLRVCGRKEEEAEGSSLELSAGLTESHASNLLSAFAFLPEPLSLISLSVEAFCVVEAALGIYERGEEGAREG